MNYMVKASPLKDYESELAALPYELEIGTPALLAALEPKLRPVGDCGKSGERF